MNKVSKKQYNDYRRMTAAVNNSSRYLAELQAHLQFLQRTGDVEKIEDINLKLLDFLLEVQSNYTDTLEDE